MARKGNGSSDYVDLGTITNAQYATAWTVHLWYRPTTATDNAVIAFAFSAFAEPGPDFGFSWRHTASTFNNAWFMRNSAGTYFPAKLLTTPSVGVFVPICGRWDGTNLRAAVNGANEATAGCTSNGTSAVSSSMRALMKTDTSGPDDGTLGELAIWTVSLSDDEVAKLATGVDPMLIQPMNLIRLYRMEGYNTLEHDFSPMRTDATPTGTTQMVGPNLPAPRLLRPGRVVPNRRRAA